MPVALNNVAAPDTYTAAATLNAAGCSRFNLHVFNQAIFFKVALRSGGPGPRPSFGAEMYRAPGLYSFDRPVEQIAIRAAVPLASLPAGATQARVTIDAWTEPELGDA